MFNIYVGWDSREDVAYQVCRYSVLKHASVPVNIIPLKLHELKEQEIYTREHDKLGSTEFTFSRFLVPYLNKRQGWAMFVDCDFLFTRDIAEIFEFLDESKALMCVKHNYTPTETTKMDGQAQHLYPRKNWSSMMLFNCAHPSNHKLSLGVVNNATGQYLHRFQWLQDEEIGGVPKTWNWLEGWYPAPFDSSTPAAIHHTRGGPWFKDYQDVDYGDLWLEYFHEYAGRPWTDEDFVG